MERLFIAMFLMVLFFPMSVGQYQNFMADAPLRSAPDALDSDVVGDIGGGDTAFQGGVEGIVTRDADTLLRSKLEETFQTSEDFQTRLQYFMTLRDTMLFGASPNQDVLIGKDGWLYLSESLAARNIREEDIALLGDQLQDLYEMADRNDVAFAFMVVPDKKTLSEEHLPATLRLEKNVSLERLSEVVQGLPFIDLLEVFSRVSRADCLYSPLDTHWSPYGAYLAYSEIMEMIGGSPLPLLGVEDYERTGDLSYLLGLEQKETTCAPVVGQRLSQLSQGGLLFYGDSFGEGLISYFDEFFEAVDFHLIRSDNPLELSEADLAEYTALIIQVVERDLHVLLPDELRVVYQ